MTMGGDGCFCGETPQGSVTLKLKMPLNGIKAILHANILGSLKPELF